MNIKSFHHAMTGGIAATALLVMGSTALAQRHDSDQHYEPVGLVKEVIKGTKRYRDVSVAEAEGWASLGSCVSADTEGAMGVHYANLGLIGDGMVDAQRPEALIYEAKHGRMQLVGVEFILIAEAWHANNGPATPALMGQLFHYTGSPNRYGLPPFYALHVWAWKDNPNGAYVNWHPNVSCNSFVASVPGGNHQH